MHNLFENYTDLTIYYNLFRNIVSKMSQTNYHRNLLNIDFKILKYAGIWVEDEHKKNSKIYIVYVIFVNFFIMSPFIISHAIRACFVNGNILQLVDIGYLLIGISVIQIYSASMFVYRKEICQLNKLMEVEASQIVTKRHEIIIKRSIKIWTIIRRIQYCFICIETVLFMGSCIPAIFQREYRETLFANFWIPFDLNKSPNFEYAFLVQTMTLILGGMSYTSFQYVFLGYFSFLATQCEILCYNLRHVKEFPEDDSSEFQCTLGTCVQHYNNILK